MKWYSTLLNPFLDNPNTPGGPWRSATSRPTCSDKRTLQGGAVQLLGTQVRQQDGADARKMNQSDNSKSIYNRF